MHKKHVMKRELVTGLVSFIFSSVFCAVTMVTFQVLMMWMSLIRYCHDNRLFMSTNSVCHMVCSRCRFPSSLRGRKEGRGLADL